MEMIIQRKEPRGATETKGEGGWWQRGGSSSGGGDGDGGSGGGDGGYPDSR